MLGMLGGCLSFMFRTFPLHNSETVYGLALAQIIYGGRFMKRPKKLSQVLDGAICRASIL